MTELKNLNGEKRFVDRSQSEEGKLSDKFTGNMPATNKKGSLCRRKKNNKNSIYKKSKINICLF